MRFDITYKLDNSNEILSDYTHQNSLDEARQVFQYFHPNAIILTVTCSPHQAYDLLEGLTDDLTHEQLCQFLVYHSHEMRSKLKNFRVKVLGKD